MREILAKVKNYDQIIWDWNGTLLDDVHVSVEVIGVLLEKHGLPRLTREGYRDIFQFPIIDYYKKLGFDFEKAPFKQVADEFVAEFNRKVVDATLFDGTLAMLESIQSAGIRQAILSAATQWHLDEITAHFELTRYFTHIYGIDNHYAASKLERGRELLKASGINPARTLLIGDTDHDLEVASELGTDALLIADGHQSHERLASKHHDVMFTRFIEA